MERLILLLPPSVNHMYANGRIGHRLTRVLTSSAKTWLEHSILETKVWIARNNFEKRFSKTIIKIYFYFPDYRRRDTHNNLKILMDCLEKAGIYEDDRLALPWIIDYQTDKSNPRIEIEIV